MFSSRKLHPISPYLSINKSHRRAHLCSDIRKHINYSARVRNGTAHSWALGKDAIWWNSKCQILLSHGQCDIMMFNIKESSSRRSVLYRALKFNKSEWRNIMSNFYLPIFQIRFEHFSLTVRRNQNVNKRTCQRGCPHGASHHGSKTQHSPHGLQRRRLKTPATANLQQPRFVTPKVRTVDDDGGTRTYRCALDGP